jgi:hypothetical protein
MSKQMSCSQVIGRAIRKFGLPAVVAAVEMAEELSAVETPKRKVSKPKAAPAVASQVSST